MTNAAPRPLVAGNWKMNGGMAMLAEPRLLATMLKDVAISCDVMICPPAILIDNILPLFNGTNITVGGQDCHWDASGAHTGDTSAEMLKEAGCAAVIVGHSERRTNHAETDAIVAKKAAAAHRASLTAIICIGETLEERKSGKTLEVLTRQIKHSVPASSTPANTVIAYEPVWAIGTGLTASTAEVTQAHTHIRAELNGAAYRILYGGSVKPANAAELMGAVNVNGALVGGASLKAADFIGIIKAYA